MYAILHKNKLSAGPKNWNRAFFSFRLNDLGIKTTLPNVAPKTMPFEIDADTKIVSVTVKKDDINPMTQYLTGPLWQINDDETATAFYAATDTPLEAAKNNFRNQAAEERYKKEVAGTKTTVQDIEVTIDTTRDGRNIFIQKLITMDDNETVNWKFPETWLLLTKTDLAAVVQAGAQYIQACFDWEKNINDQIDQANTADQLLEIEIVEKDNFDVGI